MSLENSVMYPPLRRFGQQLKIAAMKTHNLSLYPVAAPGHLRDAQNHSVRLGKAREVLNYLTGC